MLLHRVCQPDALDRPIIHKPLNRGFFLPSIPFRAILSKSHANNGRIMLRFLLAVIILSAVTGCQDAKKVKRSLNGRGYSQVELTGYTPSNCGMAIGFNATTQEGARITGTVCSEWKQKTTAVNLL